MAEAELCAGTTITWQPRFAKLRSVLNFTPKSTTTTRNFSSAANGGAWSIVRRVQRPASSTH